MKKAVLLIILIMVAYTVKGQSLNISYSLKDSCININEQLIPIQITIQNDMDDNIWIDLNAIEFVICRNDTILNPFDIIAIGSDYIPDNEEAIKNGFVLIKRNSNLTIIRHTSIFRTYQLDYQKHNTLKGYYRKARNKRFSKVYDCNRNIGEYEFMICN
ncbi:MAG: hypothetical protein LBV75_06540 [Paludibacter sp.]|nr:hypothetical protein [Paludibacter sp.]